jgi:hypothetical protein
MTSHPTRRIPALVAAALLALPVAARAADPAPSSSGPAGLLVVVDIGGGGQIGAGSAYDPPSVFELELTVGYDVVAGVTPQMGFVLGMSPGTSFAIRPGLSWYLPETPFFLRAAVDASTQVGYLSWRWLLLGGGFALKITDVFGFQAEVDTGIPLASGVGVPIIARAGAFVRF